MISKGSQLYRGGDGEIGKVRLVFSILKKKKVKSIRLPKGPSQNLWTVSLFNQPLLHILQVAELGKPGSHQLHCVGGHSPVDIPPRMQKHESFGDLQQQA